MKFWKQKTFKRKVAKTLSGAAGGLAGGLIGAGVGAVAGGLSGGKGKVLKNFGIGGAAGFTAGLAANALGFSNAATIGGFKSLSTYAYNGLSSIGKGSVPSDKGSDNTPPAGDRAPSTPFYSDLFKTLPPIPATSTPADDIMPGDHPISDSFMSGDRRDQGSSWVPVALVAGAGLLLVSL